jgi:hypothetical protein
MGVSVAMPPSFSVGIYPTAPVADIIRLTRLAEDLLARHAPLSSSDSQPPRTHGGGGCC